MFDNFDEYCEMEAFSMNDIDTIGKVIGEVGVILSGVAAIIGGTIALITLLSGNDNQ